MKTRKKNKFLYCLTPFAFLLLLFLLLFTLSNCEKKSPPQEAPEEVKPVAIKPEEIKSVGINLKEIRLAVIPEDYDWYYFQC